MASPAAAPTREAESPSIPPERGAPEVERAARGEKLDPHEEHNALHYLLGPRKRIEHEVTVQYETPEGTLPLKFIVLQMDGRELDRIEIANVNEATGRSDVITANCQIVAAACVRLETPDGESIDPKSEQYRTINPEQPPLASLPDVFEMRFKTQLGLLSGVAREVRSVSGWSAEKVGPAKRVLVEPTPKQTAAAGNS